MDLIIGSTDDRFNCSTSLSTVGRTLYIGRQYRVTLNAYRPCFSAERRYAPKSRNPTGFISLMLQAYQPYFATLRNTGDWFEQNIRGQIEFLGKWVGS
jgi:hypothetical protein